MKFRQKILFNTYLQTLYNRKYLIKETKLVNNITDVNRIINKRIRREFLRENTLNDRENINLFGDDNGKYFRNQPDEVVEQKRAFDGEYYLPINNQFRMKDINELYNDDTNRFNREHDTDQRYMQNDEELFNPNRFSNDYNRQYNNKNFHDYYHLLKKQSNRYGKKSYDNDFLDKQD